MREFLKALQRYRFLLIVPLVVLVLMIALAAYLVSRPVLGTAIYQP